MTDVDPTRCPLCGQSNTCTQAEPARAGEDCWCFAAEIAPQALERIPAELRRRACLCPRCAQLLPAEPAD
ncbi:Cysteine-rich CWC [compost metagenome]